MPRIKALFFDFMGTCLDWHAAVMDSLPAALPQPTRSDLALAWREAFFAEIHARAERALPPEDIDATHERTLLRLLGRDPWRQHAPLFSLPHESGSPEVRAAVRSWHRMAAWPDVLAALAALRDAHPDLELFVLANGTTRLQLDLVRSSGLAGRFALLFSSELLGVYKPAPEAYRTAMKLVGAQAEESVMVAAHAYDLRAARAVGMRTVYIRRWTDDTDEDMERVRGENEVFLEEGIGGLPDVIGRWMENVEGTEA